MPPDATKANALKLHGVTELRNRAAEPDRGWLWITEREHGRPFSVEPSVQAAVSVTTTRRTIRLTSSGKH